MKRARVVAFALGALVVAGAALEGPTLVRRARHRLALARALEAVGQPSDVTDGREVEEALVGFEEAEAVVALVERFGRDQTPDVRPEDGGLVETGELEAPDALRRAVELFAVEPEPRDPGPRLALEALARDESAPKRFWALYLLDELEHPRHAREPDGFALQGTRILVSSDGSLLEAVRAAAQLPLDLPEGRLAPGSDTASGLELDETPWRALVRLAQLWRTRVVVEGRRVRLDPEVRVDRSILVFGDDSSSGLRTVRVCRTVAGKDDLPMLTIEANPPAVLVHGLPSLGEADLDKAMRAYAALNGLELEERGEGRFLARATDDSALVARVAALAAGRAACPRGTNAASYVQALVEIPTPGSLLALVQLYAEGGAAIVDAAGELRLIEGVAVSATDPLDARVRSALEALAAREDVPRRRRFIARYCLEELAAPAFPPAPAGISTRRCGASGARGEILPSFERATGFTLELAPGLDLAVEVPYLSGTPWRILVLLCHRAGWMLSVNDKTVRVSPRPPGTLLEDWKDVGSPRVPVEVRGALEERPEVPDAAKGLRALAALAGRKLVVGADGSLGCEPLGSAK